MALGLALFLLGCSSSKAVVGTPSTARPSASPSASPGGGLDSGWILHADVSAGFAVAFPDAWVVAMTDSPTQAADIAQITTTQQDLGAYFVTAFASSKTTGLALLAADPRTVPSGFTSNASVFRSDLGPSGKAPDLDAITLGKLAALNKDSTISGTVDRRHVQLHGNQASRIAYVFKSGGKSVEVVSYLMVKDIGKNRIEYELTIGSAIPDYGPLFDKVAASFVLGVVHVPLAAPTPGASLNPSGPGPVTSP